MYFNGLLLLSAHRMQIATQLKEGAAALMDFVSAHRVQIATVLTCVTVPGRIFVSAHSVRITTGPDSAQPVVVILCLSAPRADRNAGTAAGSRSSAALSQRTACRSQRQMCTKHRVRICGMRCESVDSFSQHEDLLRADYFPELFCYQSSLCCH